MKCQAEEFEQKKQSEKIDNHEVLAIVVASVGETLSADSDESIKKRAKEAGLKKPRKSLIDDSEFCSHYVLTAIDTGKIDEIFGD